MFPPGEWAKPALWWHVVHEYYDVPDKPVSEVVADLKSKFVGDDDEAGEHISDQVGEVIATYQTEGFEAALISEKAKVWAAMRASKVDGTPTKQKAFDGIDAVAATCWEPVKHIEV